jgi:hypothetical protein
MAIYPKGNRPYLFGLNQCSYPRFWTPQEERLFQEIGRRLADALTSLSMFRSLRQSEARLEEAQRIAHLGHWERDIETNRGTWSDETYRIFGLAPHKAPVDFARLQALVITVSDTGVGFEPDDIDKIFRAFFTTKDHGTGMGLPISRSIIESHGGRLWASSNPERGATFQFSLPAAVAAPA